MSRRGAVLQDYGGRFEPIPLESQINASQLEQRTNEFNAQLGQQKKQKSDTEAGKLIGDIKLEHIGDNTIDVMTDKQLQALQQKLMDMHLKGATTTDLQVYAQNELPKIANGHTVAKNKYDQIKSGLTELGKDYTTGDFQKARELAVTPMLHDVLDFDEKGNPIGYKDPSIIPEKNYVSPLLEDNNLAQWYKPSGAFQKGVKDLPLTPIGGGSVRRDARGKLVDQTYTGHASIFDQPIADKETGKLLGQELKYEKIGLGKNPDGSIIEENVIPVEQFNLALPTAQSKADFRYMFNQDLKSKGINPTALDPRAKDILQRKYMYDLFKSTNLHGSSFLPKDIAKEPLPPRVSVKINNGSSKEVPVMDIVTPVKDYFKGTEGNKKEGLEGVAQINLFNNEVTTPVINEVKNRYPDITADDIYYQKDGNDIWVMKADEAGKVDKKKDVPVFKLDDFSNVAGNKTQGQKSKNEALKDAQKGTNQQPQVHTGYTRADLKNGGWTDKQIDAAVKAGKIKLN